MSERKNGVIVKILIGVVVLIIGNFILRACGIIKESPQNINTSTNTMFINNITFDSSTNIYVISGKDITTDATVTVATPNLLNIPSWIKSPFEEYLKSHNQTVEDFKK